MIFPYSPFPRDGFGVEIQFSEDPAFEFRHTYSLMMKSELDCFQFQARDSSIHLLHD